MATGAELAIVVKANTADAISKMEGLGGKLKGVADKAAKFGKGMTIAGGAAVAGLGLAVKSAVDFEGSMREVNTMMGLGQDEFQGLSDEVKNLSTDLGVSAVDSAKALYQAISAGVPKENVIDFMTVATKTAIAGVTDTETAVDGLTTVMNAFKIPMEEAQKVADVMFTTVKGGKTTISELSASMFNVAPIASASGIAFEEVSGALATMTKQGVPTAQATTQLRMAMIALQAPTEDMKLAIEAAGFASGQAMVKEEGLATSLDILSGLAGGSTEQLKKMFGSVEAVGAVLALTGENTKMFTADLDAMAASEGAMSEAHKEMEKSTSVAFGKMKAKMEGLVITVGEQLIPILIPLAEQVGVVISKVADWMEKNPKLVSAIVKVVAVVGSLMLVLGPLLMILPGIMAALPLLGAAFAILTGPIGLVIAAIAGVIAIGVLVAKNWDDIIDVFKGVPGRIGSALSTVKDIILAPYRAAWAGIGAGINWLIDSLNKIQVEIPSWVPVIGGKSFGFNIPNISLPSFQRGGIVPGPAGTPVPVLAHGGERFLGAGGRGSGSGAVVINNYISGSLVSERELGEMIRDTFYDIKLRNVTLGLD